MKEFAHLYDTSERRREMRIIMKNTMKAMVMVVMTMVVMMFYGITSEAKTNDYVQENTMMKPWIESRNDQEAEKIWLSKTENLIINQIEKTINNAKTYQDIAILKEVAKFATDNYWNTKNEKYLSCVNKSYNKIFEIEAKLHYLSILENQEEYGVTIKRIGNTIYADFGNRGTVIFVLNPENEIVSMHS